MADDTLTPEPSADEIWAAAAAAERSAPANVNEPPADEPPPDPVPPVEKVEEPPADDPWASAPEPLRAEYQKLRAERDGWKKSESSFQRRIRQQHEEILRLKSTTAPIAEPTEDAVKSRQDRLAKLNDEYPEVAEPVMAEIDDLRQQVAGLVNGVSAAETARREAFLIQQQEQLTQQHPDWLELVHNPGFKPWLEQQPRHIREAMQRNSEAIEDADEAGDVVGRFGAYLEKQSGSNGQAQDTTPPPAAQTQHAGLADRRRRQLDSATSARSHGPAAATGMPGEDDGPGAWEWARRQEEQERRTAVR